MLVAVYGSLRKGFHNHRVLEGRARLVASGPLPGYKMYSFHYYPGIVPVEDKESSVYVEVYETDDKSVLMDLDILEGYHSNAPGDMANLYERVKCKFFELECWIYVCGIRLVRDLSKREVVSTGVWPSSKA